MINLQWYSDGKVLFVARQNRFAGFPSDGRSRAPCMAMSPSPFRCGVFEPREYSNPAPVRIEQPQQQSISCARESTVYSIGMFNGVVSAS